MAAEDYFDISDLGDDEYYLNNSDEVTNKEEEWDLNHHCPGKPVLRTNHNTGDKFYGCSEFPKCRKTMQV